VAENDSTTEKAALLGMAKEVGECDTTVVSKGHCVVYTVNGMRFKVPLVYHGAKVFTELLRMSQEEFGFVSSGHITLPCDAACHGVCHLPAQKKRLCRGREGIFDHHSSVKPQWKLYGTICRSVPAVLYLQLLNICIAAH
jgi:hypothetical protein